MDPTPTDEQRRALQLLNKKGRLAIEGAAGTGKTLLAGLASKSAHGAALVLTSTRTSTAQTRLRCLSSNPDSFIDTFDAFAWRLTRAFGHYIGLKRPIELDGAGLLEEEIPATSEGSLLSFDAVHEACAHIIRLPGVINAIADIYQLVVTDETQDNSALRLDWLIPLLEHSRSLVLFDRNQYLQPGDPELVSRLDDVDFPQTRLSVSMRCGETVSEAARCVLSGEPALTRVAMRSVKRPTNIAADLKPQLLRRRHRFESIAVLGFTNKSAEDLSNALASRTKTYAPMTHSFLGKSRDAEKKEGFASEFIKRLHSDLPAARALAEILSPGKGAVLLNEVERSLAGEDRSNELSALHGTPPLWLRPHRLKALGTLSPEDRGRHLELWQLARISREKSVLPRGVFVSTIHSAKGREFDAAIILDDAAHLPGGWSEEHRRRLGYVAVTRARDEVVAMGPGNRASGIFG